MNMKQLKVTILCSGRGCVRRQKESIPFATDFLLEEDSVYCS